MLTRFLQDSGRLATSRCSLVVEAVMRDATSYCGCAVRSEVSGNCDIYVSRGLTQPNPSYTSTKLSAQLQAKPEKRMQWTHPSSIDRAVVLVENWAS
jgi:hypothetical protein